MKLKGTNEEIITELMRHKALRFYDPEMGVVFNASPCEHCNTMTAHAGHVTIPHVTDRLHRTLISYYSELPYKVTTDYDDDGELRCEVCEND